MFRLSLRDGPPLLLFLRNEADADFRAVDADQFASPKCQAGGGQQQEELLVSEHFERTLDFELGAGRRDVQQDAFAPPGAVDTHKVDGIPVFEMDAIGLAIPEGH